MSLRDMDNQITLSQFRRIFLQTPSNWTTIYHSRTWGGFPEIRFIDGNRSEQVDPLKTLYKKDMISSAQGMFYHSQIHYPCVLERKLT